MCPMNGYERVGAIILAAGESRRMGFPKQLLEICGERIIRIIVKKTLSIGFGDVVVVLGHMASDVARYISDLRGIKIVINARYREGMSASLVEGVKSLVRGLDAFEVILGDQPLVSTDTMRRIIDVYYEKGSEPLMVIPTYMGSRGNPVLISSRLIPDIMMLRGDVGARALMERYRDRISYVEVPDPGVILDIDTKEDLEKAVKLVGCA